MLNKLKIGTKIGASFALGVVIFATISLVRYRDITQLIATARQETHTYKVIGELEELSSQIKNAETGQRGYIITGEKQYLEPYNAAIKVLEQEVKILRGLTADSPNQQRRLDTLEPLLNSKLAELRETITLRQNQGFAASLQVVLTDRGKQLMDDIHRVILQMENEERELLQQRSLEAEATAEQAISSITYGVPFYCLVLALIGFFLARHIFKPLQEISGVAEKLADRRLIREPPSLKSPGRDRRADADF